MRARLAAVTTLLIAFPIVAGGQASSGIGSLGAKGFFLGAALNGSSLEADDLDSDRESGGGLLLHGGFGFNPNLALFLDVNAAQMENDANETWYLSHADFGLRYHFAGGGRRFVPYLEGAVTAWMGSQDNADIGTGTQEDLEISGTGYTLGGGILYFFSSRLALLGGLKWTKGEFNEVKFGNVTVEGFDIDATSTRLNIGLTWFLGSGR